MGIGSNLQIGIDKDESTYNKSIDQTIRGSVRTGSYSLSLTNFGKARPYLTTICFDSLVDSQYCR